MSVDIVNLIESNPITKLNGNYQSKLIEKVKNRFTEYEQQMFIASFYCYLNCDYNNDFVIDLDNIWKWLGFSQKVNAKTLLEKQFTSNVDFTQSLLLQQKQTTNTKGGQNKEIFMLNINTFKKFCLKAGTKKADEIHDYFIKLENLLQEILYEETDELKQQLLQVEDQKAKEYETKLEKQKVIEREKVLLKEYGTIGSIFYVIKVKTYENKQYVIKVGESRRGITDRYKEHKSKYEECLLIDCFTVNKSKDFETFIKEHDLIRPNKVKTLPGHEAEMELFLIGKHLSYQTLLNIITNNIKYFNNNDTGKLQLENEQLKLMLEMKSTNNENVLIQELIKTIKHLSHKVDAVEKSNKEILHKFNSQETKVVTGFSEPLSTIGPRLQKINPETLGLIKFYESVSEVMKENSSIKRPSINKAVVENTVYCGYRWLLVDRELDPNVIHNIIPTKQTKIQNLGYIAQINQEQTAIVNVFLDRKTAAHFNGYDSSSALDIPVKKSTLSQGYYYKIYTDCDLTFREKFEEKINGSPLLYKNGVGQYDLQQNLIREFSCKYDCIKTLLMSDKTLAKALTKNIPYNGFYFKEIGSKLKCV
uniref:MSV199 domain-containing protein n=1 Tax=viral metagenome TaxID=1070528 RepID=A0A6C0LJL8_9ZZZZ